MDQRQRMILSLKDTILDLVYILKHNILLEAQEQGDLTMIEFIFNRMHPEMVVKYVTEHILPHSKQIKSRDLKFFMENDSIFHGLPEDRIKHYSTVIITRLTTEDREEIWQFFDVFLTFAEELKKNA